MKPRQVGTYLIVLAVCIPGTIAQAHWLNPNNPDPFCSDYESTTITCGIHRQARVQLAVEDIFANRVALLYDGQLQPGFHVLTWHGQTDALDTLRTGVFAIRLLIDDSFPFDPFEPNEEYEDPATAFCGSDLEGPFYLRGPAGDLAVAFAAAVQEPAPADLTFLTADEQTVVRQMPLQFAEAGVQMVTWDLLDTAGERVPGGFYICRFEAPGFTEDIHFLLQPMEPIEVTGFFTDANGLDHGWSTDPQSPSVLLTPILGGQMQFSRPLTTDEFTYIWENIDSNGSVRHLQPDSFTVLPDTSGVVFDTFETSRPWPDIHGPGELLLPPFLTVPSVFYFHLRHEFHGITYTDENCAMTGPIDPDDWQCREESYGGGAPTAEFCLAPACPNPVRADDHMDIYMMLSEAVEVALLAIDCQGDVVRRLVAGHLAAGNHVIYWDLRDDGGTPLLPGIYRIVLEIDRNEQRDVVCGGDVQISDPAAVEESAPLSATATRAEQRLAIECSPNPVMAGSSVRIFCSRKPAEPLAATARATTDVVHIHDVTGREVRALSLTQTAAQGRYCTSWDGLDAGGESVPAGVYFIHAVYGSSHASRQVLVIE